MTHDDALTLVEAMRGMVGVLRDMLELLRLLIAMQVATFVVLLGSVLANRRS